MNTFVEIGTIDSQSQKKMDGKDNSGLQGEPKENKIFYRHVALKFENHHGFEAAEKHGACWC
jgi:hypothetical protein